MTLYGRIGEDDVEQLVDSIKEQARSGDKHAAKLLLDLITKASAAPPKAVVTERVVMVDPGARQLRLLCAFAIAKNGPMLLPAIAALTGMAESDASNLLDSSWFDAGDRGFELTILGKQQVG